MQMPLLSVGRFFRTSPALSHSLVRLAAVIAVAAASGLSAQAAVIYSGVQNVTATNQNLNSGGFARVDLDMSGGIDIRVRLSNAVGGDKFFVGAGSLTNEILFTSSPTIYTTMRLVGTTTSAPLGFGIADKLAANAVIGAGSNFIVDNGATNPVTRASIFSVATPSAGQWLAGDTGYFGFQFNPSGSLALYGWGQLSVRSDGEQMTLVDWAYESSGSSIQAGAVTAVPEPSIGSLCLFGLSGLILRRRRPSRAE